MTDTNPDGYASSLFADVYRGQGTHRRLHLCQGSVLLRSIAGTSYIDAMGCYPLFSCRNWDKLADDIATLDSDCVSLVLILDPFCPLNVSSLRSLFDHVVLFKHHFVADLEQRLNQIVSSKRLRSARSALRRIDVDVSFGVVRFVQDWMVLQDELTKRHDLSGMHLLSSDAVARLIQTPGAVVIRAVLDGVTIGMHVDIKMGDVVHAHLAAYAPMGYAYDVSAALSLFEINYFRGKAKYINWGGNAGYADDPNAGLAFFKSRFATERRPVYLCGRICNRRIYKELSDLSRQSGSTYFPAYRARSPLLNTRTEGDHVHSKI